MAATERFNLAEIRYTGSFAMTSSRRRWSSAGVHLALAVNRSFLRGLCRSILKARNTFLHSLMCE
jgi:hypothetical protein